jgi:aminobenzoyl-glutamate utilization protein B
MVKMRPLMEPYYYDSRKYNSYLDQLGIKYPSPPVSGIRRPPASTTGARTGSGG